MNKIVEVIRGNPEYRFFATTVAITDGRRIGDMILSNQEEPTVAQKSFITACQAHAGIGEVSLSKNEIAIQIGEAFQDDKGYAEIRDLVCPLIAKHFYPTNEYEYRLKDDHARYTHRGWDL